MKTPSPQQYGNAMESVKNNNSKAVRESTTLCCVRRGITQKISGLMYVRKPIAVASRPAMPPETTPE